MAYVNAKEPLAAALSTGSEGCCGGGGGAVGAEPAAMAEERRFRMAGGRKRVLPEGGGVDVAATSNGTRGRGCRCWWVAIAAVVVIALVAKS